MTLYACIYRAAKHRIRKRAAPVPASTNNAANNSPETKTTSTKTDLLKPLTPTVTPKTEVTNCEYSSMLQQDSSSNKEERRQQAQQLPKSNAESDEIDEGVASAEQQNGHQLQLPQQQSFGQIATNLRQMDETSKLVLAAAKKARQKRTLEAKRERKAFQTLAIVTGTFIICWLPFFVTALIRPLCGCEINDTLDAVFVWLGWSNSLVNPVIYTVFAPDFRNAFKKILMRLLPCHKP